MVCGYYDVTCAAIFLQLLISYLVLSLFQGKLYFGHTIKISRIIPSCIEDLLDIPNPRNQYKRTMCAEANLETPFTQQGSMCRP